MNDVLDQLDGIPGAFFLCMQGGQPVVGGGEDVFVRARGIEDFFQVTCVATIQLDEHAQDRHVTVARPGQHADNAQAFDLLFSEQAIVIVRIAWNLDQPIPLRIADDVEADAQ